MERKDLTNEIREEKKEEKQQTPIEELQGRVKFYRANFVKNKGGQIVQRSLDSGDRLQEMQILLIQKMGKRYDKEEEFEHDPMLDLYNELNKISLRRDYDAIAFHAMRVLLSSLPPRETVLSDSKEKKLQGISKDEIKYAYLALLVCAEDELAQSSPDESRIKKLNDFCSFSEKIHGILDNLKKYELLKQIDAKDNYPNIVSQKAIKKIMNGYDPKSPRIIAEIQKDLVKGVVTYVSNLQNKVVQARENFINEEEKQKIQDAKNENTLSVPGKKKKMPKRLTEKQVIEKLDHYREVIVDLQNLIKSFQKKSQAAMEAADAFKTPEEKEAAIQRRTARAAAQQTLFQPVKEEKDKKERKKEDKIITKGVGK